MRAQKVHQKVWHSADLEKPSLNTVVIGKLSLSKDTVDVVTCKYNQDSQRWETLDGFPIKVFMWRSEG